MGWRGRKGKGTDGKERPEICYICMSEDSIMKSKHCIKNGGGENCNIM
jgi:hypothetical protein